MMPEDRLRQAEALLETAARYITRHEEAIVRQAEVNTRLDLRMLELVDMFSELAGIVRQHEERIQQNEERIQQNEERYRENQEEIRRIWEYLSSQSGNGRSSN